MNDIDGINEKVEENLERGARFNLAKYAFLGMRLVFWLAAISILAGFKTIQDGVDIPRDLESMLYVFMIFGMIFCLVSIVVVSSDIINMLKSSFVYKTISQLCIVACLCWFIWIDKVSGIIILSLFLVFSILYYVDKKYGFLDRFRRQDD